MSKKKHPHRKSHSLNLQKNLPEYPNPTQKQDPDKLEIVLKCDFMGSQEAVSSAIVNSTDPKTPIEIIHSDVGSISESDLQMALTGSRLVIGFNVDVMSHINQISKEHGIEIRLYNVIYHLINDLKEIAGNLFPPEEKEMITGEAKVIALFKSSRKGIILGCEVLKDTIAQGNNFRVISAMGPVYTGKIESLHIEQNAVKKAKAGQQVGLKISNFKDAKIGDMVECFKSVQPESNKLWRPRGGVFRFDS